MPPAPIDAKSRSSAALSGARALQRDLVRALAPSAEKPSPFEAEMAAMRRHHIEHIGRVRDGLLSGELAPEVAGRMISDAAARDVRVIAERARADVARRRGPVRGVMSVLALGKLGGAELTLDSDLDLIFVFAADDARTEIFGEIAAMMVDGLTRFTEDGGLYDVDLRLRPYGDKGPAAVQASSFKRYFSEEAWTWELQSLTRARVIAGDPEFGLDLIDAAAKALEAGARRHDVCADVAAMRARLQAHKQAANCWDVKLAPGGLIDVEFIVQALTLTEAAQGRAAPRANTGEAILALQQAGVLSRHDAFSLRAAWSLYSCVRQFKRALRLAPRDMAEASDRALTPLLSACGTTDREALAETLRETQAHTRALFETLVGRVSNQSASQAAA